MPDSLYPCTESKPARRQPGEHCKAMRWRSHARDFSAPQGRAAANVIRFGISFAARSIVGKMVGNGVRKP